MIKHYSVIEEVIALNAGKSYNCCSNCTKIIIIFSLNKKLLKKNTSKARGDCN